MRFIDLTTKYHITRDRLFSAISIICILIVSTAGVLITKTVLDNQTHNDMLRRQQQAEELAAATTETSESATSETTPKEESAVAPVVPSSVTDETSSSEASSDVSESIEESVSSEETTAEQTTTTEATTTAGHSETELYMTVYASGELNLRTGPGTEYELVRVLSSGDAIDVVAVTDNGWYRTYNGNYVSSGLTTTTPPVSPSTVPQTEATAAPTAAATAAPEAMTTTPIRIYASDLRFIVRKPEIEEINEDVSLEMYEYLTAQLKDNGYEHYEISNFAKEGFESKHNLVYWNNNEYYGFGPGASGYIDKIRYDNTKSLTKYIEGAYTLNSDMLSKNDKMDYEIMLGLRKMKGINVKDFHNKYGVNIQNKYNIKPLLETKELIFEDGYLFINPDKIYIMNEILIKII